MTQRSSLAPAALAATLTLALAGCGLSDPYTTPRIRRRRPRRRRRDAAQHAEHDRHGDERRPRTRARRHDPPQPHRPRRTRPPPAPRSRRRRRRSSATPPSRSTGRPAPSPRVQHELAAISIGQARAQALQAQASYAQRRHAARKPRRQQRQRHRDRRRTRTRRRLLGDRHPRDDHRPRRLRRPATRRPRHPGTAHTHPRRLDRQLMVTTELAKPDSGSHPMQAHGPPITAARCSPAPGCSPSRPPASRSAPWTRRSPARHAPHPTLSGSLADALADPAEQHPRARRALSCSGCSASPTAASGAAPATSLMLAVTAASAIPVGIELGRWHAQLLPYIPQLPLEWAALATTVSAWLLIRTNTAAAPTRSPVLAVATAVLLIAAAALETWCTPHRQPTTRGGQTDAGIVREPISTVGAGGCLRRGFCAGAGHTASRSHAPFPSRSSVPLGRPAGADRATSTTTDPHKEGIT